MYRQILLISKNFIVSSREFDNTNQVYDIIIGQFASSSAFSILNWNQFNWLYNLLS